MTPVLTVGVTTRNRRDALRTCISSLAALEPLAPEILVFDDASDEPVADHLAGLLAGLHVRVIRDEAAPGYIAGRNRLVREARGPLVLLLDDDARLLEAAAVERAMALMNRDRSVAAVAFAQGEVDGRPWPAAMQPSPSRQPVVVPSFIGFAHVLRRDVFLALGGYREIFKFYGEEKEYGLRLLDAGYRVVYLPDAVVIHAVDPAGRDPIRYLRFVARNDCLATLYNDPLTRLAWTLPVRYALYFRMRRRWKIRDPWGWLWLAKEITNAMPALIAGRKPVSRAALRRWAALRRNPAPYA